ncbi:MAG: PP2C family serine/threonine-protein phosphatase [Candidatus Nanopelagicales bacterium]
MTLHLRYAAKSNVGMVRKENEDSGFAGRRLLAVADGMGGHAAGELASSTAIATLAELDSEDLTFEEVVPALKDAIETSAERIAQFILADPARAGMGTTMTAIAWRAGRIVIIHVGDSRAYLLRDGQLHQLTRDHTYVQSLVDAGRITEEEARRHPKRNLLMRAIDGNDVPESEPSIREAQAGDRYLLCTDGLSGVVTDAEIARVLAVVPDPTAAVTDLVELALEAGAPDNVTVVVADVVDVGADDVVLEATVGKPVVVGAAGERRNRAALPGLLFPDDVGPDSEVIEGEATQRGPEVVGGLVARGTDRARSAEEEPVVPLGGPPGSIGEAIDSGELVVGAAARGGHAASLGTGIAEPGSPVGGSVPARPAGAPADEEAGSEGRRAGDSWARQHWRALSVLAVLVAGTLIGLAGFTWWLSSQWFVGTEGGYVVIYQGVPQQVGPVDLNRVVSRTALEVSALPYVKQQEVERTIDAGDEVQAQRIVADLQRLADECAADKPPLGCPVDLPEGGSAESSQSNQAGVAITARRQAVG